MTAIKLKLIALLSTIGLAAGWLWNQRRLWTKRGAEQAIDKMEDADEKRAQQIREAADLARRAPGGVMHGTDTRGYRD